MVINELVSFQSLSPLDSSENPPESPADIFRFNRVQAFSHLCVTRCSFNTVQRLQVISYIFFAPVFVKLKQRRKLQTKYCKARHQAVNQGNFWCFTSPLLLRLLSLVKVLAYATQQPFGRQMLFFFDPECHQNYPLKKSAKRKLMTYHKILSNSYLKFTRELLEEYQLFPLIKLNHARGRGKRENV